MGIADTMQSAIITTEAAKSLSWPNLSYVFCTDSGRMYRLVSGAWSDVTSPTAQTMGYANSGTLPPTCSYGSGFQADSQNPQTQTIPTGTTAIVDGPITLAATATITIQGTGRLRVI